MKKYRKRPDQYVIAIQLNLETDGMTYSKWGHMQAFDQGDWLIYSDGECYTVREDSFEKTYSLIMPGMYLKTAPVWAYVVDEIDSVRTNQGATDYEPGDYWVSNDEQGQDAYAVSKENFERMYELVE